MKSIILNTSINLSDHLKIIFKNSVNLFVFVEKTIGLASILWKCIMQKTNKDMYYTYSYIYDILIFHIIDLNMIQPVIKKDKKIAS